MLLDQYDLAKRARDLAVASSRRCGDVSFAAAIAVHARDVDAIETAFRALGPDAVTMAQQTAPDPAACLKVGEFRCYLKADWAGGLPLLAKSNDAVVKALAAAELLAPTEPDDQMKIADGWWKVSDERVDPAKRQIMLHAGAWYQKASLITTGLDLIRAQARLKTVESLGVPAGGHGKSIMETMRLTAGTKKDGIVELTQYGSLLTTPELYKPPVTFTFVAKTSSQIRFGYAADQFIFGWEGNPTQLRVDGGPANGQHKDGAGGIVPDQWTTFELTVLPNSLRIRVNGQERYTTRADFSNINQPLEIRSVNTKYVQVKSVEVSKP